MAKRIAKEAIDRFFDYGLMLSTRTLYIGGAEIDQAVAENAIKGLHILENSGTSPINIILNSEGGDVDHGFAIYDAIRACSCSVTITVYGSAMSMGSIILQAADHRIVAANSRIMIHHGILSASNHSKNVYKWADSNKKMDDLTIRIYLAKIREKHPTMNYSDVDQLLNFDTLMSGQEAVDLGLADEVISES